MSFNIKEIYVMRESVTKQRPTGLSQVFRGERGEKKCQLYRQRNIFPQETSFTKYCTCHALKVLITKFRGKV